MESRKTDSFDYLRQRRFAPCGYRGESWEQWGEFQADLGLGIKIDLPQNDEGAASKNVWKKRISLGGKEVKSQTTACLRKYCEEDSGTGKVPEFCDRQGPVFKSHQCWIRTSQFRAHRFWEMQGIPRQALKNNAII